MLSDFLSAYGSKFPKAAGCLFLFTFRLDRQESTAWLLAVLPDRFSVIARFVLAISVFFLLTVHSVLPDSLVCLFVRPCNCKTTGQLPNLLVRLEYLKSW